MKSFTSARDDVHMCRIPTNWNPRWSEHKANRTLRGPLQQKGLWGDEKLIYQHSCDKVASWKIRSHMCWAQTNWNHGLSEHNAGGDGVNRSQVSCEQCFLTFTSDTEKFWSDSIKAAFVRKFPVFRGEGVRSVGYKDVLKMCSL